MARTGVLLSLLAGSLGAQTTAPAERQFRRPFLQFVREVRLAGGPVTALSLGPHGRWVASGGTSGVVKVRDAQNLRLVVSLDACDGAIGRLAMAPHEPKLAVLGPDLSVWRLPEGQVLARVPVAEGAGDATKSLLAWSADGRRLAYAAPGERVMVLGATDFAVVASRRFGPRPLQALAFSPGGDQLYVTVEGGETSLWEIGADRLRTILLGDGEVSAATLPDGRLVQGRRGGGLVIDDRHVPGLLAPWQLAVSPAGDRIATGAPDQTQVEIHDGEGRWLRSLESGNHGGVCFALGPDGLAATGGAQGHVTLWRDGERIARFSDQEAVVDEVAFSGDGATVVARWGRQACAFDVASGRERERFVADAIATGSRPDEVWTLDREHVARFDVRRGMQPPQWTVAQPLFATAPFLLAHPGGGQLVASLGDAAHVFADTRATTHVEDLHGDLLGASWSADGTLALGLATAGPWAGLRENASRHALWLVGPDGATRELEWSEHIAAVEHALDGASLLVAGRTELVRLRLPAAEPSERVPTRVLWLRHVGATRVLAHDGERVMLWQATPLRLLASQDLRWSASSAGRRSPTVRAVPPPSNTRASATPRSPATSAASRSRPAGRRSCSTRSSENGRERVATS